MLNNATMVREHLLYKTANIAKKKKKKKKKKKNDANTQL
jgi:hypothetical protein